MEYAMEQLVLVPPVIDEHNARSSAVMRTNKFNLVIARRSIGQLFHCDPFGCLKKFGRGNSRRQAIP
jgi:hypothetical protein